MISKGPVTGRELMKDLDASPEVSPVIRTLVRLALASMAEDLRARARATRSMARYDALCVAADLIAPEEKT